MESPLKIILMKTTFRETGAIDRSVLFINLANDPAIERIATPRSSDSVEHGPRKDTIALVIMTETNYCGKSSQHLLLRRSSRTSGLIQVTSILTTQPYETCRRLLVADPDQIPILPCRKDDITHPIPDLTGYIKLKVRIILSYDSHSGYRPPNCLHPLSA